MPSLERELADRLERGQEVVLATVIRLDGRPPSRPGAKLLLGRGRALAGTLGCSEFDSAAIADAEAVLDAGTPVTRTYSHDLGSIEAYLEPHAPAPVLVVFAATPVAEVLLRWGSELGYRVLLHESREQRLQGLIEGFTILRTLNALREAIPPRCEIYAVHTDHDAPDLEESLEAIFALGPRFVGLMGSRRHTGHHLESLRARGMDPALIDQVRSPVGLDIGAKTPEEIALSILGGLVAVRHDRQSQWLDR